MTYPRVTIRGEDLPEPFDGWDDREHSDGTTAVYYPSRFEIKADLGMLYLVWQSDEAKERRWISLDQVNSIDSCHDDELSENGGPPWNSVVNWAEIRDRLGEILEGEAPESRDVILETMDDELATNSEHVLVWEDIK